MSGWAIVVALGLLATLVAFVRNARGAERIDPDIPDEPEVAGTAVLICHRRDTTHKADWIAGHWGPARKTLVQNRREAIGFRSYAQIHHVSRWQPIYLLIRASRSWLATLFFSFLHGLPYAKRQSFKTHRDAEDWDVIEILMFDDDDKAQHFLSATDDGAMQALNSDSDTWTRRRQVVPMQITRAFIDSLDGQASVFNLYLLRAREYLGRNRMLDYWLSSHRRFVLTLQTLLRYVHYDQNHATDSDALRSSADAHSRAAGKPWDAVAALGYTGMDELWRGLVNPRVLLANTQLVYDETRFIDAGRSSLMLGQVLHRL